MSTALAAALARRRPGWGDRVAQAGFGRLLRGAAPVAVGLAPYGVNNLSIWSGWLKPPEGHTPLLMNRASDIAQYMTWVAGFQREWLIPDYHAPVSSGFPGRSLCADVVVVLLPSGSRARLYLKGAAEKARLGPAAITSFRGAA